MKQVCVQKLPSYEDEILLLRTVVIKIIICYMLLSEGLVHAEGESTRFMVASGGLLSEGYGHGGPGVCLGDGQTEAEVVSSQGERGDALLRRMSPYLT